ncbi:50S ribosomal protein L9 [Feifania hominis]|uniref:Large ribosomal subunit protein bL9 n=1 Tax=Feifania hominis TaxID=2763660 RepID=A0A926HQR0_9FIRM|nr:50S ribosomal protein L9 [Feifania hominis]MBC8536612.1 50S ribosomal protein L9 [Feifania hominis]
MKVILQADLKGTGKKGELITVSDGYARNYLFPRKLAVEANKENMTVYTAQEAAKARRLAEERKAAEALAAELSGVTVKVSAKGGASGKLFGSITTKEIAEALKAQKGIELDKKKIVTDDIKTFGTVEVEAKIYPEVSAKFYVAVSQE